MLFDSIHGKGLYVEVLCNEDKLYCSGIHEEGEYFVLKDIRIKKDAEPTVEILKSVCQRYFWKQPKETEDPKPIAYAKYHSYQMIRKNMINKITIFTRKDLPSWFFINEQQAIRKSNEAWMKTNRARAQNNHFYYEDRIKSLRRGLARKEAEGLNFFTRFLNIFRYGTFEYLFTDCMENWIKIHEPEQTPDCSALWKELESYRGKCPRCWNSEITAGGCAVCGTKI